MIGFDTVMIVDWSASATPSPVTPSKDAIWIAVGRDGSVDTQYCRTRSEAMALITQTLRDQRQAGARILVGFDFPFGYPTGFAKAVTGTDDPLALWDWLAAQITDNDDNSNNRFEVAAALNARFPRTRPFWGRPATLALPHLPATKAATYTQFAERRVVEARVPKAQPVWKLYTTGSVGSQALLGLARLAKLRSVFGEDVAVWPFQAPDAPIVLAEIWPSLLAGQVAQKMGPDAIKDEVQVRVLAKALMDHGDLTPLFLAAQGPADEGWILGVGSDLGAPTGLSPPPLRNDCFALPAGVEWMPVTEALARLQATLGPVVAPQKISVSQADGRILACDVKAPRANPPGANSAVDGYGFAASGTGDGPQTLPLVVGRAAAGAPFEGAVPDGHAVRILTGALVPDGVDTVILEEDTSTDGAAIAFRGPVKRGANTRRAGEDVDAGARALLKGQKLRPPDLALLSAVGVSQIEVFDRLRVGILSTGDELAEPGTTSDPARTYDANRPMLLALAGRWGHIPVDLGHVGDDRAALRHRLDSAQADVILTSGGASAGDEDHVSALLRETGSLTAWRIALKPGRPLALGTWNGVPVFGLPGNPVAAFVCALIFARPALTLMAGGGWQAPVAVLLPAAFTKRKKPGRQEYLRARLGPDGVEVFASEGSGRISGLSWADGLVELPVEAAEIAPGDPVRYLSYATFGL